MLGGDIVSKDIFIETRKNLIYWANNSGKVTKEEAMEISNQIKLLVETGKYDRMIVDNSNLRGVWNSDVDKIWVDLMKYVAIYIPRTATLCENVINKLQVLYLSSQTSTPERLKAFTIFEKEEFQKYINYED